MVSHFELTLLHSTFGGLNDDQGRKPGGFGTRPYKSTFRKVCNPIAYVLCKYG